MSSESQSVSDFSESVLEARALAIKTDSFIRQRGIEIYGSNGPDIQLDGGSVSDFVDAFVEGQRVPLDRLVNCTLRRIDVELENAYINFTYGLENRYLYGPLAEDAAYQARASTRLARMALTQTLIGQSRILWEKIFRLVYYLEVGADITGRSIKGKFFAWAKSSQRWCFLEVYEDAVNRYDDIFRTPEYHKHSAVRADLIRDITPDPNVISEIANLALPVPINIASVLRIGRPASFSDSHCNDGDYHKGINPRYTVVT